MLRHAITLLMLILITVQVVAAVADNHWMHQSGTKHATFRHLHDESEQACLLSKAEPPSVHGDLGSFDCNHCCHCHGLTQLLSDNQQENSLVIQSAKETIDYQANYTSFHASPDIPPPIY